MWLWENLFYIRDLSTNVNTNENIEIWNLATCFKFIKEYACTFCITLYHFVSLWTRYMYSKQYIMLLWYYADCNFILTKWEMTRMTQLCNHYRIAKHFWAKFLIFKILSFTLSSDLDMISCKMKSLITFPI